MVKTEVEKENISLKKTPNKREIIKEKPVKQKPESEDDDSSKEDIPQRKKRKRAVIESGLWNKVTQYPVSDI